jgi:hypothetical protein
MSGSSDAIAVYIEAGAKKTFAVALEWPGWCRSGRDETSALRALLDAGPRYGRIVTPAFREFRAPGDVAGFEITERVNGNATTDFGAPNVPLADDAAWIDAALLRRMQTLLRACWGALQSSAAQAAGKELRRGPRGGGRDLDEIVQHVLDAEASYLGQLGWRAKLLPGASQSEQLDAIQRGMLDGLTAASRGELPTHGPRCGRRWGAHTYARRSAWHIVDHAWEIEDRAVQLQD